MKTIKLSGLLIVIALFTATFTSCKKDATTSSPAASSTEVATAQDAESEDAVMTPVEQGADNTADALETNGFNVASSKAGIANGVDVTIVSGDTTTFPILINLVYNYSDTVNGEHMSQSGTISISVDTIPVGKKLWWRKHVIRQYTFTNFTVTTDSNSFTVNGTRTMKRQNWNTELLTSLTSRTTFQDSITSALTVGITNGSFSGQFTRNTARLRSYIIHFYRLALADRWYQGFLHDTLDITGKITGLNLQDSAYSRTVTTPAPLSALLFTFCPVWPYNLLADGILTDKEGSKEFVITYSPDGCKTNISVVDGNGKTVKISHKIDRSFKKWW